MTKKVLFLVCVTFVCVLVALPAMAKVSDKERAASAQAELIEEFGMPEQVELQSRRSDQKPTNAIRQSNIGRSGRTSLGASVNTPGNGVGEIIDNTYNDLQRYALNGRTVEHSVDASGNVDVHFVYEEFNDVGNRFNDTIFASPNKTGYNVWDAIDSTWPWGQESGCLVQDGDSVYANWASLDIMPSGLVVIGCYDNFLAKSQVGGWATEDDGFLTDNHIYYQEDRHSCFWDTGGTGSNSSHIPESMWKPDFVTDTGSWPEVNNYAPSIAVQVIGSDTITHVLLEEASYSSMAAPHFAASGTYHVLKYFRKLGGDFNGTWEEPQVIDTNDWGGASICASNWTPNVAVFYDNISPYGVSQDNDLDVDYFYRESSDGGVNWGPVINITSYERSGDVISGSGWYEIQGLYTSDGNLHAIFTAITVTEYPYRNNFWWADFSANLYHWGQQTDVISKVAHGNYGIEANGAVCGYGSPNSYYVEFYSMGSCDGNLYAIWNQIHHKINELGIADGSLDCSTNPATYTSANWEIFLSVSSTMAGLLWDSPRNLTDTYTPGCDSALGDSGACGSEYKPSMEKYGLNESGLGLKWPAGALIDPDTIAYGIDSAYDGDYFLNAMYLDDEYPGTWYFNGAADRRNDVSRFNALKWLRIACVDPIQAPAIAAAPRSVSWTNDLSSVKNGQSTSFSITVTNDGNMALDVYEIATVETTGSGWLGTSVPTLAVPAGIPNTGTFDVQIDASGLTYGLGNSSWLDGEIFLISDAGNADTLVLTVHILAADSIPAGEWEIAATSTAWDPEKGGASALGDNTALSISNWGEIGHFGMNGDMEANLDFSLDGGECRTGDRGKLYAWGGSPFILQHDGGGANPRITSSFNLSDQAPEHSFDPLPNAQGIVSGVSGGGEYDSVFTGAFANRDTSLILERTFFAPRDNPNNPSFIVCKTVMYSGDGQAHDNVTIGSFTDWDIPSVESPDNKVGVSDPGSLAGQFVYAQGTDVDTTDPNLTCQDNINRYGTELFLDWHTNAEYNLDDCAANDTTWGAWGASQVISDPDGTGLPNAEEWYDSLSARNGYFANDTSFDQSVWVTYLMDQSLGANDTLTFYSLFATLRNGSLSTFEGNLVDAKAWYLTTIRGAGCATCCVGGTMGNIDCTGIIDIGDVTVMISNLFITLKDPCCIDEADLDVSGLVDIGDLTMLISSLFITLRDLDACP